MISFLSEFYKLLGLSIKITMCWPHVTLRTDYLCMHCLDSKGAKYLLSVSFGAKKD